MGRRPQYSTDDLLDAALRLSADGPAAVTMAAVARICGAPSGSMYHRFASRDEMMARLWLRTITEYQAGFLTALRSTDDTSAAIDAAIGFVFDWTAANPAKSTLLLQFDEKAIVDAWPDTLATDLAEANSRVRQALHEFTRRHFGTATPVHVDRVIYALADLPYTAVRRHLPTGRPREWLREFTIDAAHRVLSED